MGVHLGKTEAGFMPHLGGDLLSVHPPCLWVPVHSLSFPLMFQTKNRIEKP